MYRLDLHKQLHLSMLIALGLILFLFETLLPRPLPWFKPGLANLATVLTLYRYRGRAALWVTGSRVLLGSWILGTFSAPVFWLAISAGLGSTLIMVILHRYNPFRFSPVGISLLGAFSHNVIQLWMAYWLIVGQMQIFRLLPLMLFPALLTGPLIGFLARLIQQKWPALAEAAP